MRVQKTPGRVIPPEAVSSWGGMTAAGRQECLMGFRELTLPPGPVELGLAGLDVPGGLNKQLGQLLSRDERERAARFRIPLVRDRYVVRRALLRILLARYVGDQPSELRFHYGGHGKPALSTVAPGGSIHFNVAHSQELALYVFSRVGEVGVDIESMREFPDMPGVLADHGAPADRHRYATLPKLERTRFFYEWWTQREAVLKGIGCGISGGLKQVEIVCRSRGDLRSARVERSGHSASSWLVQALDIRPGVIAAVAIHGSLPSSCCPTRGFFEKEVPQSNSGTERQAWDVP